MIMKNMVEQKFCQDCDKGHHCQKVYERLGKANGPSVVWRVVIVFLLPMVVFIVFLAVFEGILAGVIDGRGPRTAIGFLLALLLTFVFAVSCSLLTTRKDGK